MSNAESDIARPVMAAHVEGDGPPVIMLHGGYGCWRHWVRNVPVLAEQFTVHAFDLPSYGESAAIDKTMSGEAYLEIVYQQIVERFGTEQALRLVGFSFGGAICTYLAGRLKDQVSHLAIISPGGFPPRETGIRNMMSYKAAFGDEDLMRRTIRHNLLQHMLFFPESVDEEAMAIQRYCVDRTRFDSRKVSRGGGLMENLAKITCPLMVLWGEKDDFDFRPADEMIGQIREVVPGLRLHRIEKAGHWSAYENAPQVNAHLVDFFKSAG